VKSSDAKASKCHLKFYSKMIIFIKLVYLSSVISPKWHLNLKYTSLIKMIILEENFKWHLEAFASELFKFKCNKILLLLIINLDICHVLSNPDLTDCF